MEHTFYGVTEVNLDDKGRVIIPVRYRGMLEGGLFVTHGLNGCVWIMTPSKWDEVNGKLATVEMSMDFDSLLCAGELIQLDRQGRLTIPPPLRRYAGLVAVDPETRAETVVEKVVMAGARRRLEIWQPERWEQRAERASKVAADHDPNKALLIKLGL